MEEGSMVPHAVFIVLAILSSALSDVFTVAAAGHLTGFEDLFQTTTWNVSDTFSIEVTLDHWVSSTWIMLTAWSAGWLFYALTTVIRRNALGPVCCNPEIHPPSFYLIWILINVLRISWLFLWDRQYIIRSLGLKILIPFSTYVMLFVSYRNLHQHQSWFATNSPNEIWFIRFMTQNGLALFATLSSIEALINMGVALKYSAGLQDPLVSTVVLTVLFVGLLVWFTFESFIFEKYTRYTFTVYPVVVLCLGAMFTRSYRVNDIALNTIYCGFLMIAATILNTIRLIAACFYTDKKPTFLSRSPIPLTDSCETVYQVKGKEGAKGKFGIVNNQFSEN
ncbi:uncharacterized protein LOC118773148 [Megalops cyprinoides]|uniref:uncharacterized protein LOC118773148 n=1 Tax=Megalops cyprinoides TaxID=118141 RepID=UPI0018651C75|nr:uncharacterized protein LOC118773148 [Megalops cyprinoides]